MNKVILIGRIANDVKLFHTQSGVEYARTSIAVTRRINKENPQTDFIPIIGWRTNAQFLSQYVSKGSLVCVEGQVTTGQYSKNSEIIRTFDVTIDSLSLLEPKSIRENRQNLQVPNNSNFEQNSSLSNETDSSSKEEDEYPGIKFDFD